MTVVFSGGEGHEKSTFDMTQNINAKIQNRQNSMSKPSRLTGLPPPKARRASQPARGQSGLVV
jgi:hypothetical protein